MLREFHFDVQLFPINEMDIRVVEAPPCMFVGMPG